MLEPNLNPPEEDDLYSDEFTEEGPSNVFDPEEPYPADVERAERKWYSDWMNKQLY